MAIPDLLQWVQSARLTGRLRFRHMSGDVDMRVREGELVHVASPSIDAWAASRLGEDAWRKALDWAARDATTPTEVLVRVGLLDRHEVVAWLNEAGRRALNQLLLSDQGWFAFEEDEARGSGVPVERLLLDVARDLDERDAVRTRFGGALVWLEAVPGAALADVPGDLAAALRTGVHLIECAWLFPDDAWEISRRVHRLVDAGQALALPVEIEGHADPLRAYQDAVICERSFRYEAAAAGFEAAISAAWGESAGQEAASRWCERYLQLVDRHLIPGDRLLQPAPEARPAPGDPYAAFLLRRLRAPQTLGALAAGVPFHRFFAVRSARRLAAAGQIHVRPAA